MAFSTKSIQMSGTIAAQIKLMTPLKGTIKKLFAS